MQTTRAIRPRALFLAVLLLWADLAACRGVPEQRYELKGKVVSVDKARGQVTLAHDPIPGYMEAMTMPFTLKDKWPFDVLSPGSKVQAELVVAANRSWLENLVVTQEVAATGGAGTASEPSTGDEVPDFTLVNQDGKRIHLRQYRGRTLLLTFIYTRCPLPDFCPLMSRNFAEVDRALQQDPTRYEQTHLLSISVDPEYDRPPVLRKYGMAYTGKQSQGAFKHWEFASGTAEEVKAVAQFFGLQYWPEAGQIVHSLSTAVIAPDGKVYRFYRGNEWKPAEILNDVAQLNQPGASSQ